MSACTGAYGRVGIDAGVLVVKTPHISGLGPDKAGLRQTSLIRTTFFRTGRKQQSGS